MASASVAIGKGGISDCLDGKLALFLQEVERYNKEKLGDSDIDAGYDSGDEEEGQSDPEDDALFAMTQQMWRPAIQLAVRDFVYPAEPSYDLPGDGKPLD